MIATPQNKEKRPTFFISTSLRHQEALYYSEILLKPQEFSLTFDEYFSYVYPDDRAYVNDAIENAFKGEPYSIDNRIITANGEERIVHTDAEITFNEDNIPVYARGIIQDITECKQADEASRRIKEQYQTLFNSISEGFGYYKAIYNEHGTLYDLLILEMNPAGA